MFYLAYFSGLVREYKQNEPPRNEDGSPGKGENVWMRLPEQNLEQLLEGWKKKYIDLDWCPVPEYWSTTLIEGLDDNGKIDVGTPSPGLS